MLEYQILENKPSIYFGDELGKDLLDKTMNIDNSILADGNIVEVNEYYVARPDLVSLAIYGDDKYGDIICKINGISNPFELNIGQLLFIPNLNKINNIISKNSTTTKRQTLKKEYISTTNKEGNQKAKNERRSPNEQIIGDKNYIIDKSLGLVFY